MDNFYYLLRIFCAGSALLAGWALLSCLVRGRAPLGPQATRRADNPTWYWAMIAQVGCIGAGFALAAFVVKDGQKGPVVSLSCFVPSLAAALVTGRFAWEAEDRRIDKPRRFWAWVAAYVLVCLMMIIMLIWP